MLSSVFNLHYTEYMYVHKKYTILLDEINLA